MLPIFRIIMLADDTVELSEILSVDMFFILNRLRLPFSLPASPVAVAVRSVVARLISLLIAAILAKVGDGIGIPCGGVAGGGEGDLVDVSDGDVKTEREGVIGVTLAGEGGVDDFFVGLSRAFRNLPFRPPLFVIFSVGSGEGAIGFCARGEERGPA